MENYNYVITIITLYNTIKMEVEDIENDEIKQILSQPYIIDIKIDKKTKELKKFKK